MARVFRRTYLDKSGIKRTAPKWYLEFKDQHDIVRRLPGTTDKASTARIGDRIERLVNCRISREEPGRDLAAWIESLPPSMVQRLAKLNLVDARRIAAGVPLLTHLADFEADLQRRGRSPKHVALTMSRASRVVKQSRAAYWSDLTPEKIERALSAVQAESGVSDKTRNAYLTAVRMFCNWMISPKVRRAATSPAEAVDTLAVELSEYRRALTIDELRRLIAAAAEGPDQSTRDRRGGVAWVMTGPERACLYSVACQTGLRASSLRRLRVADFDLDAEQPLVRARGKAATKTKRDMAQPIQPHTAALLRVMLASRLPESPAFDVPHETAAMLRADLVAARASWIAEAPTPDERAKRAQSGFLAEQDEEGRRVDFHALRTTTGTLLALADVPRAVTQRIMGHSSYKTTDRFYTRPSRDAGRSAVEQLPDLTPQVATGTDGAVRDAVRIPSARMTAHDIKPTGGAVGGQIGEASSSSVDAGVSGGNDLKGRGGIRTHVGLLQRICNPPPWSTRARGRRVGLAGETGGGFGGRQFPGGSGGRGGESSS